MHEEKPAPDTGKMPETLTADEALLAEYAAFAEEAEEEHQHDCPCCRER
ncbi:MAG: hypothetical protein Q4D61_01000 [Cardiobacteriaceae bacterium]|nr:hypothetical protein [Cardiobacteriaceae bacterium]